jgi:DHA2 family multidrug resistance protein
VLFGSLILLPVMLQTLFGYPSLQAGIAMAPRGLGSFIAMPLAGFLTARMDARRLVAIGFALGAATLFWLGAINLQAGYWDVFWPQVLQGFAVGLLFVPLTTATMDGLAREEIGNASTLFNLMRNVGGGIGIAMISTLLTRTRITHAAALSAHVTPYDPATQAMLRQLQQAFQMRGSMAAFDERDRGAQPHGPAAGVDALAFIDMFRLLGVLSLVMIPLVFLLHAAAACRLRPRVVE